MTVVNFKFESVKGGREVRTIKVKEKEKEKRGGIVIDLRVLGYPQRPFFLKFPSLKRGRKN